MEMPRLRHQDVARLPLSLSLSLHSVQGSMFICQDSGMHFGSIRRAFVILAWFKYKAQALYII